jgi:hypothetical protein
MRITGIKNDRRYKSVGCISFSLLFISTFLSMEYSLFRCCAPQRYAMIAKDYISGYENDLRSIDGNGGHDSDESCC